jgi:hypothetical protein
MRPIRKGLLTLLTAGALYGIGCSNSEEFTEARIGNLSKIPSNVPATFYRAVVDIDRDGNPDKTLGYNAAFRSVVAVSGEPTLEEKAEFYKQKAN